MLARAESDFDFFSRRAMEEARAAANAKSAAASTAHRRMAAAYAALLREEDHAVHAIADTGVELSEDVDPDEERVRQG